MEKGVNYHAFFTARGLKFNLQTTETVVAFIAAYSSSIPLFLRMLPEARMMTTRTVTTAARG